MLKYPEKIAAFKEIPEALWQTSVHLRLFTALKQFSADKTTSFVNQLSEAEKKLYAKLSLEADKVNLSDKDVDSYLKKLKNKLKQRHLELQIEQLKKKLETINKNDKNYDEVFKKLVSLEFERHKIKMEAR
jgi:light-regulated signal transduction histidine kinase (bacteriophytochrome)